AARAGASRRMQSLWTKAVQPWLFLRACLEWKRYQEEGPGMISHLPIPVDGSCNGYQQLGGMGLDPIGGRATNLMPFGGARARAERERASAKPQSQGEASSDDPEDIYQWVSDLVCRRMEREARARQGEAS